MKSEHCAFLACTYFPMNRLGDAISYNNINVRPPPLNFVFIIFSKPYIRNLISS